MLRLSAIAAVALLAACGGASDGEAVRSAAAEWLTAVYDSDGERACALLTAEARDAITSCEVAYSGLGEAMGESLGAVGVTRDELADGRALDVELQGDEATVTIDGTERALELERTPDGWRVSRGLR